MTDPQGVSLGEVARRVDRLDREMQAGFAGLRDDIRTLTFVPPAVYAADRQADGQRFARIERDLADERECREEAQKLADQRAWQARLSMIMALVGLPISVFGSIVVALAVSRLQ